MNIRFCEFTGDDKHFFDEQPNKCQYIGIMDLCLLHKKPLHEYEGWRVCCSDCTQPVQCKTV